MKKTLTILFLLTGLISNGQNFDRFKKEDERDMQIRITHGVYVVRSYDYSVDENRLRNIDGKLKTEITFNQQGQQIKNTGYVSGMVSTNEIEYNEKGQRSKLTCSRNGKVWGTYLFEYDENGTRIKEKLYDSNGLLDSETTPALNAEYKYDSIEHSYTSVSLLPTGEIKEQRKYWVNDSGQVIKESVIDNVRNKSFYKVYIYDTAGNQIESHEYSIDGKPLEKSISTYNDKNLKIETVWYSPYDLEKRVTKYEYEYY